MGQSCPVGIQRVLAGSLLWPVSFETRSVWSSTGIGDFLFESKISMETFGCLASSQGVSDFGTLRRLESQIKDAHTCTWPLHFTSFGVV